MELKDFNYSSYFKIIHMGVCLEKILLDLVYYRIQICPLSSKFEFWTWYVGQILVKKMFHIGVWIVCRPSDLGYRNKSL